MRWQEKESRSCRVPGREDAGLLESLPSRVVFDMGVQFGVERLSAYRVPLALLCIWLTGSGRGCLEGEVTDSILTNFPADRPLLPAHYSRRWASDLDRSHHGNVPPSLGVLLVSSTLLRRIDQETLLRGGFGITLARNGHPLAHVKKCPQSGKNQVETEPHLPWFRYVAPRLG